MSEKIKSQTHTEADLEKIYQIYSNSCKRSQLFPCVVFTTLLYYVSEFGIHVYWLGSHSSESSLSHSTVLTYVIPLLALCISGTVFSILFIFLKKSRFFAKSDSLPHFVILLWSATLFLSILLRKEETLPLRVGLGWLILEIFLIIITFPTNLKIVLIYTGVLSGAHICTVIFKGRGQELLEMQLAANILLIVGAHVIGILGFRANEARQRLAFDDSCQSLEVKDVMELHAGEQQRLLLSVLPKHLVETMTQASESSEGASGGFKKIYMHRHEPVTILFADIVGFTAMSAALGSASKLVEILDELFSMFDSLAEQHSQVRIKILGDCYYCICGAPEERPDHAILCVHMGLAVVEAIKYFQKRTNTAVDMRVGIHTGAVLAGILGQRQWQFDVYSKDVDLANIMESGGIPGKVHVSDKTLSFLNGEFEVEDGFGETREEGLRMAGVKTYFITKVLKPFKPIVPETKANEINPEAQEDSESGAHYRKRLQNELLAQDGNKLLAHHANKITLRFKDKEQEDEFESKSNEGNDGIFPYVGSCVTINLFVIASFLVISFRLLNLLVCFLNFGVLCLLGFGSRNADSHHIMKSKTMKNVLGIISMLILTFMNTVLMLPCIQAGDNRGVPISSNISGIESPNNWPSYGCVYPPYIFVFCSFFLLSITLFSDFYFWSVSLAGFLVVMFHIGVLYGTSLKSAFQHSEIFSFREDIIGFPPETTTWTLFLVLFFLALVSLSRRLEMSTRIRFLCKFTLGSQKEQAAEYRVKNEVLMCNIMPRHVANHFLNPQNKSKGLYSENYLEAGVIFAAMPNFGDFYTEDAVNNQGLECLRFLNEVISDYDALLDQPKYNGQVIKIKTIGSTYMAASGLKQSKAEDSLKERWRHLSLLVEFALDMKKVLNQINEQSYNQFVLKIGISHGEITAGVIGNTKPAYDIWGNTANVSSRMYSTGKADKIQVTDETYKLLRMYGYQFERRGFISVKGKGEILTYFLIGSGPEFTEEQILQLQLSDE